MPPLSQDACSACNSAASPLSEQEIQELLQQVTGWELRADGKAITLKRKFKNFKQALDFVNELSEIAETERHHPDIAFGWGYAEITLQTHAIDALHRNDFIVAAKMNELIPHD